MTSHRARTAVLAVTCLAAVAVVVGANSNSLSNSFHFDDSHVVEGNLYIRNLANIPRFFADASTFSSFPANATYRPLVSTTLAVDYWLADGLKMPQFHLSQITMLVVLAAMVFVLFERLLNAAYPHSWNRYVALAAALLSAVHTTNAETMNLLHARSELISAMGIVGAFLVYIYAPASRSSYLFVVPMIVGALAKSPSVIFAPLFLLYLILFEEKLSFGEAFASAHRARLKAAVWRSLPVFLVGALTFVAIESLNGEAASYGGGSRFHYFQTQLFVWVHYARLFLIPIGLTADTDWTLIQQWYDTRVIAGALFIALLVRLMWSASKQAELRPAAFGIAWFGLTLLPASSIFPLAEVANEHRIFQPFIGLSLAVASWLASAGRAAVERRARFRPVVALALSMIAITTIAASAVGTYERNKVFLTEETLWRDVVDKSPGNGRGWMNYGLTQMAKGQYAEAKRLFDKAETLLPNYSNLEVNLGIVTSSLGDPVAAEKHFLRALELAPEYPAPRSFYARWLVGRGRTAEAIPHLKKAVEVSPADLSSRYSLMDAYAVLGQVPALKALVADTLSIAPTDIKAQSYLDARGEIVVPTKTPNINDVGRLLNESLEAYRRNDFEGSIALARQLLAIAPESAEAYNNLAASYASLKKWDDAIQAAQKALQLKPDFQLARNNLAWAESEKRKNP